MSSSFTSVPTLLLTRKLRTVTMVADGNCFYRAISSAFYKDVNMHHLLRRITMDYMINQKKYLDYFGSVREMNARLNANKRLGVWNTDLADLVPQVVSDLLNCCIEVYAVSGVSDDDQVLRYSFGRGEKIRLLLMNNHYDLLIKKC